MATIKAFRGVRPVADKASAVAALPYDVYTEAEAREAAKDNPYSFLHIDRAEIDFDEGCDPYGEQVYLKARENLDELIKKNILIQDPLPCMYIYRLEADGRRQTGLCACVPVDEYLDGTIRRHELTREDKELDRIRHIEACDANTGPIFLCYRACPDIGAVINDWTDSHKPVYDFTASDGVSHTVWVIDESETLSSLRIKFGHVKNFYIADGHHRNEAAAKVAASRRKKNPSFNKEEEFNFYEAVIFPDEELLIMGYNRLVKDLNGYDQQKFLDRVSEKFHVEEVLSGQPDKKGRFGMYIGGKWRMLTVKNEILQKKDDVIAGLDVSILQNEILEPILGIKDPRTDKRIDFVGGVRGLKELERRVDSGDMTLAFVLHPTSVEELLAVSDSGKIMPPKSTWFEPKLRSGLFIHPLN